MKRWIIILIVILLILVLAWWSYKRYYYVPRAQIISADPNRIIWDSGYGDRILNRDGSGDVSGNYSKRMDYKITVSPSGLVEFFIWDKRKVADPGNGIPKGATATNFNFDNPPMEIKWGMI